MTQPLNKLKTKAGITYNSLHWWLRREFGSANKCEHPLCDKDSIHFQWSLIKGKEYDRNIENFWQLCRKCHFKYDLKEFQKERFDIGRKKAHKSRTGKTHSQETRNKIKEALASKFPEGRTVWNKGKKGCFSEETIKKMSLAKIGRIPWNKKTVENPVL